MLNNKKIPGRRSFFGSLRYLEAAYLTCKLSICRGEMHLETYARRGAVVPPKNIEFLLNEISWSNLLSNAFLNPLIPSVLLLPFFLFFSKNLKRLKLYN